MAKKLHTTAKDTIDFPEVRDIPGQEHIKPPYIAEMADTTPSSADEEGDDILDSSDELDIVNGTDADVTESERDMLDHLDSRRADRDEDDLAAEQAAVDSRDEDGELLNERNPQFDLSGEDLDTPGIEEDDSEDVE